MLSRFDSPVNFRFKLHSFDWHKKWGGTSWTWGPQAGNRGWKIEELEAGDDWHGSAPVEAWNLRLPGGIFVQAPRIVTDAETGLFRLAWLPDSDTLLRVECGVIALQPIDVEDEAVMGLEPPSLASLRCDMMRKMGDLEGQPSFVRDEMERQSAVMSTPESRDPAASRTNRAEKESSNDDNGNKRDDSDLQTIRDALQL